MKIDSPAPLKGNLAGNLASGKPLASKGGKSFGAAFDQALAKSSPSATPPKVDASTPVASANFSSETAPAPRISGEDHLETIKSRLRSGYYNSKSVDDALTEKLTGFFDELA